MKNEIMSVLLKITKPLLPHLGMGEGALPNPEKKRQIINETFFMFLR